MLCALSQPVPQSPAHSKSSQLVDKGKREFNMQTIAKILGLYPTHNKEVCQACQNTNSQSPHLCLGLFPSFTLSGFLGIICVVYLSCVCHLSATWQTGADYLLRALYVLGTKDMTSGTKVSAFMELTGGEAMCRQNIQDASR